jgi:hypothetical protein
MYLVKLDVGSEEIVKESLLHLLADIPPELSKSLRPPQEQ